MQGAVVNQHPGHVRMRERSMEKEMHSGDGIYVRSYLTTLEKSTIAQKDHNARYLPRPLYNDKDEPGKKFAEGWLRKRDPSEDVHTVRMRYAQHLTEQERINRSINKSPVNFEPINTEVLVNPFTSKKIDSSDFNSYLGMQQWKIWKTLNGSDRDIPLSQSIDNQEPYLLKVTEINRDKRKKEVETDPVKDFNAVSRRDPRREEAVL